MRQRNRSPARCGPHKRMEGFGSADHTNGGDDFRGGLERSARSTPSAADPGPDCRTDRFGRDVSVLHGELVDLPVGHGRPAVVAVGDLGRVAVDDHRYFFARRRHHVDGYADAQIRPGDVRFVPGRDFRCADLRQLGDRAGFLLHVRRFDRNGRGERGFGVDNRKRRRRRRLHEKTVVRRHHRHSESDEHISIVVRSDEQD